MQISKLLESGTKSTELKALVVFAGVACYQMFVGDFQLINQITGVEGGANISELFALMKENDAKTYSILQLLLYGILGYFAKRGILKWKEIDKLAEVQKKALEVTEKLKAQQEPEVAIPTITSLKTPLPGGGPAVRE